MTQVITATFEDGVFKPDAKLDLAPGTKVQLTVTAFNSPKSIDTESERHCDDRPIRSPEPRMTREQLHYRPTIYAERERLREQASLPADDEEKT
jgi:predicted DNA-binding antitoxin AbrB/MazE fold protein